MDSRVRALEIVPLDNEEPADSNDRVCLTDEGKLEILNPFIKDVIESLFNKKEAYEPGLTAEQFFDSLNGYTNGYWRLKEVNG